MTPAGKRILSRPTRYPLISNITPEIEERVLAAAEQRSGVRRSPGRPRTSTMTKTSFSLEKELYAFFVELTEKHGLSMARVLNILLAHGILAHPENIADECIIKICSDYLASHVDDLKDE